MLIDWLTLKICASKISQPVLDLLRGDADNILCISPSGELVWETLSRVNIKSDSHQISLAVGGHIVISGSPARFIHDEHGFNDNVFGSMDIKYCANLMIGHICSVMSIGLPAINEWSVTRIDITENYFLSGAQSDIERILSHWRQTESGKYATVTYGNSIYVQKGNRINSGKAYYKGAQLLKNYRKRFPDIMKDLQDDYCFDDVALELAIDNICNSNYSDDYILEKTKEIYNIRQKRKEIERRLNLSRHILRLEATFGSRYWNEKNKNTGKYLYKLKEWYNYTENDLKKMFDDYFDTRFGKGMTTQDINNITDKFITAAIDLGFSKRIGMASYKTFCMVKQLGKFEIYSPNNPNSFLAKPTFYRHRKIALQAGLTLADFETGRILPFTRKNIEMIPVISWHQIEEMKQAS